MFPKAEPTTTEPLTALAYYHVHAVDGRAPLHTRKPGVKGVPAAWLIRCNGRLVLVYDRDPYPVARLVEDTEPVREYWRGGYCLERRHEPRGNEPIGDPRFDTPETEQEAA